MDGLIEENVKIHAIQEFWNQRLLKKKSINDSKHTEMYCGMVHLTNDHKPNESTDGYQYFDNVGGGCKNPDCVGGKLSH